MKHLTNLRANSPIACGGMVTYLLRKLHPGPVPDDHTILKGGYADCIWFRHGNHIQVTLDGQYQWIYFSNVALRPPPVERRLVGRPRGRGRFHHAPGQLVIYDPKQEPEPKQEPTPQFMPGPQHQSASVQEQLARQIFDTIFNSTRAIILAGRQFDVAPARQDGTWEIQFPRGTFNLGVLQGGTRGAYWFASFLSFIVSVFYFILFLNVLHEFSFSLVDFTVWTR